MFVVGRQARRPAVRQPRSRLQHRQRDPRDRAHGRSVARAVAGGPRRLRHHPLGQDPGRDGAQLRPAHLRRRRCRSLRLRLDHALSARRLLGRWQRHHHTDRRHSDHRPANRAEPRGHRGGDDALPRQSHDRRDPQGALAGDPQGVLAGDRQGALPRNDQGTEPPETLKEQNPETLKELSPETIKERIPETIKERIPETIKERIPETIWEGWRRDAGRERPRIASRGHLPGRKPPAVGAGRWRSPVRDDDADRGCAGCARSVR